MVRNLSFLVVGVAIGYVLANFARCAAENAGESPQELADSLNSQLEALEAQFASS